LGRGGKVEWFLADVVELTPGKLLTLNRKIPETPKAVDPTIKRTSQDLSEWPDAITIVPLSNEDAPLTHQSVELSSLETSAPCCWGYIAPKVDVTVTGISGCGGDCEAINGVHRLNHAGMTEIFCLWLIPELIDNCPGNADANIAFMVIFDQSACSVDLNVLIESSDIFDYYKLDIPIEELDPTKLYTLPQSFQHVEYCDSDAAPVTVQGIPPSDLADYDDITCWNKWGSCSTSPISTPPLGLGGPDDPIEVTCCGCPSCSAELCEIPGTKAPNSCSSGNCTSKISVQSGSLGLSLNAPRTGSGGIDSGLTYNSMPGAGGGALPFGNNVFSVVSESLTDSDTEAHIRKCDGSILYYACRSAAGGYKSFGRNMNTLQKYMSGPYANQWTEKQANGLEYDFDSSGVLYRIRKPTNSAKGTWTIISGSPVSKVIDPFNRRTTYSYDGSNKLRRITDPFGRITTYTVDIGGRLTSQTTPELCTTELRYDSSNRLTAVVAPDSSRTSYSYDLNNWVTQVQYPNQSTYTYNYIDWNTTEVGDPSGGVTTLGHDLMRNIVSMNNPSNQTSSFRYTYERLEAIIRPEGIRTSFTYHKLSNDTFRQLAEINADGRTTWVYDGSDRVVAQINALGQRTTWVYSGPGRIVANIDALNARTSFVYDADGLAISQINPLNYRTTSVYDSVAQLKATVNPLGQRTSFGYQRGQRVFVQNPLGQRNTNVYDLTNRITAKVDPLGQRTSYIYDASCRVSAVIQPTGSRNTNIYSANQLKTTINPLGFRTSFAYDSRGNRIRVQSPMSRITTVLYDLASRPKATIDPTGLRTSTLYDAAGRPKAKVWPTGLRTTTLYDNCCDRPKVTIEPTGARTTFVHNVLGNRIRLVSPTGGISTILYDAVQRVKASIDTLGRRTSSVFDSAGQTIANINPLNQRSSFIYDAAGQPKATINPLGNRTSQVYDSAGRSIATINPKSNRWTSVYDLAGKTKAVIDPLGRRTSSVYNANGNVVASINAAGSRSTTIYDVASKNIGSVNPRGFRSTMVYNSDNQTVANVNPLGFRTTTIYDAGGRPVAALDARGNRTTSIFNGTGQLVANRNALGNRWTTIYNSVGQSIASRDPLGQRTTIVFDSADRQVATVNPLGKRTTTVFNIASQTVARIDANNHRVSTIYDAVGRNLAQIDALGYRTTTIYNAGSQTVALVDARSNRHSYTYDSTGSQTQQIDALGRRTTYAYDSAGQQTLRLDARGNRTTYGYNSVSQLTQRKYPDGTRASFTYDVVGNRTQMVDGSGRYTYAYDGADQMVLARNPEATNNRLTYTYDAVGLRLSMHANDTGRFTYAYDAANQLATVRNPQVERTTYSYDTAGRKTVQRFSNGTRASIIYDAASHLTQLHNRTSAGAAITTFDYKYDNVGNPTGVLEASGDRATWVYDNADRLKAERRSGTNAYANTFTYDATGNRTVKNADSVRTTFNYDVADQLTYSLVAAGRTTYVYDQNGNQTLERTPANARTTTTWDYENQSIKYQLPSSSVVTNIYNADSRRVIEYVPGNTIRFIWDPVTDAYLSEADQSNVITAEYTQEPSQFGRIVSQRRSTTTNWYHTDALGSTRALTLSGQSTSDTYLYDAWGNPLTSSGTTVNPFRWVGNVGYYFDTVTGLFYIRARTYQPIIARWTSVDPLLARLALQGVFFTRDPSGFEGNNSSVYGYVGGMPLSFVDPSGLFQDDPVVNLGNPEDYDHEINYTFVLTPPFPVNAVELWIENNISMYIINDKCKLETSFRSIYDFFPIDRNGGLGNAKIDPKTGVVTIKDDTVLPAGGFPKCFVFIHTEKLFAYNPIKQRWGFPGGIKNGNNLPPAIVNSLPGIRPIGEGHEYYVYFNLKNCNCECGKALSEVFGSSSYEAVFFQSGSLPFALGRWIGGFF
jgi:RHS repeat-associated protein